MVRLYSLLPWIIRFRDRESLPNSVGGEGVLEKIVDAFQEEAEITKTEIDSLAILLDPDQCPPEYLLYISMMFGLPLGDDLPIEFRRWLSKTIVDLWKIKATHPSWEKTFFWSLNREIKAEELYKTEIYAEDNYSRGTVYVTQMKAARVDLYEEDVHGNRVYLDEYEAREVFPVVERFRPAHVLLRQYMVPHILSDDFEPDDSLSQFTTRAVIVDDINPWSDSLELTSQCIAACESGCQSGSCESGTCQNACQGTGDQIPWPAICDFSAQVPWGGGGGGGGCQKCECEGDEKWTKKGDAQGKPDAVVQRDFDVFVHLDPWRPDQIELTDHGYAAGQSIYVQGNGGNLPTPLQPGGQYTVDEVKDDDHFTLEDDAGIPVEIQDVGDGLQQLAPGIEWWRWGGGHGQDTNVIYHIGPCQTAKVEGGDPTEWCLFKYETTGCKFQRTELIAQGDEADTVPIAMRIDERGHVFKVEVRELEETVILEGDGFPNENCKAACQVMGGEEINYSTLYPSEVIDDGNIHQWTKRGEIGESDFLSWDPGRDGETGGDPNRMYHVGPCNQSWQARQSIVFGGCTQNVEQLVAVVEGFALPVTICVVSVEGALSTPLEVRNVQYDNKGHVWCDASAFQVAAPLPPPTCCIDKTYRADVSYSGADPGCSSWSSAVFDLHKVVNSCYSYNQNGPGGFVALTYDPVTQTWSILVSSNCFIIPTRNVPLPGFSCAAGGSGSSAPDTEGIVHVTVVRVT